MLLSRGWLTLPILLGNMSLRDLAVASQVIRTAGERLPFSAIFGPEQREG